MVYSLLLDQQTLKMIKESKEMKQ